MFVRTLPGFRCVNAFDKLKLLRCVATDGTAASSKYVRIVCVCVPKGIFTKLVVCNVRNMKRHHCCCACLHEPKVRIDRHSVKYYVGFECVLGARINQFTHMQALNKLLNSNPNVMFPRYLHIKGLYCITYTYFDVYTLPSPILNATACSKIYKIFNVECHIRRRD